MNTNVKKALIAAGIALALFLGYRILFIRTVNYEIAGVKIPSRYSILTGKVRPIKDYHGKQALPTLDMHPANKLGLSDEQVAIAQLNWMVFQEWANSRPEFKGWDTDAETFKKANDAYRREVQGVRGK